MNKYYVYMYLDLDNIPFYIGKGRKKRHKTYNHLDKSYQNNLLKNKIRKVGATNVKIHFLNENLTEEEAFYWERYWIKYIGRRDLKEGTLCNLTDGGEGPSGLVHSDETKQRISKINKGHIVSTETRQKMRDVHKGYVASAGAKQKLSKAAEGHVHSVETKQKIGDANRGRKLCPISDETRQKMKIAQQRRRKRESL